MAARHLDEGLLGWLLTAVALTVGTALCYIGGRLGRAARAVDDNLAEFGD